MRPWTADPVIQQYRFCNVKWEHDAGSQVRVQLPTGRQEFVAHVLNATAYVLHGNPAFWKHIFPYGGGFLRFTDVEAKQAASLSFRDNPYTAAYNSPWHSLGKSKRGRLATSQRIAECLKKLYIELPHLEVVYKASNFSWQTLCEAMQKIPEIGTFYAKEATVALVASDDWRASDLQAMMWETRDKCTGKWPEWLPDNWEIGRHPTSKDRLHRPRRAFRVSGNPLLYVNKAAVLKA